MRCQYLALWMSNAIVSVNGSTDDENEHTVHGTTIRDAAGVWPEERSNDTDDRSTHLQTLAPENAAHCSVGSAPSNTKLEYKVH